MEDRLSFISGKLSTDGSTRVPKPYTGPTPEYIQMIKDYLETLSGEQLQQGIRNFQTENNRFHLENFIFEKFLSANEPPLLIGVQFFIEQSMKAYMMQIMSSYEKNDKASISSSDITGRTVSTGHRINLNLRTDLVLREVEELQERMEKAMHRTHERTCILKAEIEEILIRQGDVKSAYENFETVVVAQGCDPITQKIPAEKFVKYINDWIKIAQFNIDKMRLRVGTVVSRAAKLSSLLVQKRELGENVHEVDFEKITIENERLAEKIEQKNTHLIELKKMTGNANLVLTNYKNFLQCSIDELNELKKKLKDLQDKTRVLDVEGERTENQIAIETENLIKLKEIIENFKVPDVMEYVDVKEKLYETNRLIKMWNRKMGIQKITLQTNRAKMIKLVGLQPSKIIIDKLKRDEHFDVEDIFIEWSRTIDDVRLESEIAIH